MKTIRPPRNRSTPAAAAMLALLLCAAGARGQIPGHGGHPLMPNQELFLRCQVGRGDAARTVDVALALKSYTSAATLDQSVPLPAPYAPLRIVRYLPKGVMRQHAEPAGGPDARPLVLVALKGPTQAYQRWLVADDQQHNRLVSFIGTWRLMRVDPGEHRDKLYEAFAHELTRPPALVVSRPDGSGAERVSADKGVVHKLDELGGSVVVREFFPDFAFDQKKARPVNQSDKRLNPAALVEIRVGDKTERRWVFAKFPRFNSAKKPLPLRVRLDCPVEPKRPVPDFAIVVVGDKTLEVWTRHEGKCRTQKAKKNQAFDVPGSQYEFRIADFIPAGRLREAYEPGEGREAVRAIEIAYTGPHGAARTLWLAMGKPRGVEAAGGPITLWFGPRTKQPTATPRRPAP